MNITTLLAILLVLFIVAFVGGRKRSLDQAIPLGGTRHLNSLPMYYGVLTCLWCALPSLILVLIWLAFDDVLLRNLIQQSLPAAQQSLPAGEMSLLINSVENAAYGAFAQVTQDPIILEAADRLRHWHAIGQWALTVLAIAVAVAGGVWAWKRIDPDVRARNHVEWVFRGALLLASLIAIFTTLGIVLSVLFESLRFFQSIPISEFIFGTSWSPQIAIREGQVGGSGSFGAVPLFTGTLLVSFLAMLVAVPAGLMSAIYLSEYADKRVRNIVKPMLEILAGIPTVVYGFFAALTVAPTVRDMFLGLGVEVSSESALAAGFVMGIMIIPMISSLSDDAINAVPQSLRDGSLGLGATQSETIKQVVIPAALPGIIGGILLAVSRAIGETMIVVMAAGLAANLTANPLESVTTVTVQIVTLLVGDQEFDSPKTLAAFALGLMLFVITLTLNFVALHVVKKYREQYD